MTIALGWADVAGAVPWYWWAVLIALGGVVTWGVRAAAIDGLIRSAPQIDETGPLVCPFCEHKVAGLVHYLGQQVSCPHCHAGFHAPDHRGPTASPAFRQAETQIVVGCLTVIGSLVIVAWAFSDL